MKIIAPISIIDSVLVSSTVPETDYPAYDPKYSYMLGMYVIVTTGVHRVYQCLAGGSGNPVTDATKWLDCGPTNRWRMHDQSLQSQTVNPGNITNTYQIPGRCNSLAALNIDAASMTVTMTDVTDGVVYIKTIPLVSYVGINDWYSWFFEPIVRMSDIVLTDMPSYGNASLTVTFLSPAGNASVGGLVLGNCKTLGKTQYGMKLGITSFSTKVLDPFGNYTIVKRGYRKTGDFPVLVDSNYVDQLHRLLIGYRDTPIVYIGSGKFQSDLIYGFYKDFSTTVAYPTKSLHTISVEGLT